MFWMIVRHHARLLERQHIIRAAVALISLAMAFSFAAGRWEVARERKAERDFLERSHELVTRNQQLARAIERRISAGDEGETIPPPFGSRHPAYAATWCRQPALLPPSPLKWLSVGQSDLYPTAYAGPGYDEVSQIDNPLKLLVGHWDVTFTAVYLLPVILIALGFNLVASERESGLLQLALSQPVRASTILRAKTTTVGITVLGTVGILYASAAALASRDLSRGMLWRVTAAGLAILLYALFWLGLALMVNIWGRSATGNALSLTSIWLGLVILIPFLIHQMATRMHPVPPHAQVISATRAAREAVNQAGPGMVTEFLGQHPELTGTTELSDLGRLYLDRAARAEILRRISDDEQQSWEARLERQQKLVNRLALLSPAALLTNTLAELAGTGRARYVHFLRQKGEFEQRYNAYFLPRTLALPQSVFHAADYDLIPAMNYEEEKLNTVLGRTLDGLLVLAVYAALCLIMGGGGARHLESRPK